MTKEPWKRAAQLSQERYRSTAQRPTGSPPPGLTHSAPRTGCVVAWFILMLILGGGVALYLTRGQWLPRYRERLPEPVVTVVEEVAPEPPRSIDWHAVERGLGADLTPFGDYLLFVGRLGDWGVEPQLVETGGGTWRIAASGVLVYVKDGLIWNYDLDLPAVFADARFEPWWDDLRRANLTPDLTWTALTGESETPRLATEHTYSSPRSTHLQDGWVYPEFILHFVDGWLRHVQMGVRFGVSDETTAGDTGR